MISASCGTGCERCEESRDLASIKGLWEWILLPEMTTHPGITPTLPLVPFQTGKGWSMPLPSFSGSGEKENKLERIKQLEEKVNTLTRASDIQHHDLDQLQNFVIHLKDTVDDLHKTVHGLFEWSQTFNRGPASPNTRSATTRTRGSTRSAARRTGPP